MCARAPPGGRGGAWRPFCAGDAPARGPSCLPAPFSGLVHRRRVAPLPWQGGHVGWARRRRCAALFHPTRFPAGGERCRGAPAHLLVIARVTAPVKTAVKATNGMAVLFKNGCHLPASPPPHPPGRASWTLGVRGLARASSVLKSDLARFGFPSFGGRNGC